MKNGNLTKWLCCETISRSQRERDTVHKLVTASEDNGGCESAGGGGHNGVTQQSGAGGRRGRGDKPDRTKKSSKMHVEGSH